MSVSDEAVEAADVLIQQGGLWFHAKPLRDTSWLHRWQRERKCSHEWHSESATGADWFCCKCGKETDHAGSWQHSGRTSPRSSRGVGYSCAGSGYSKAGWLTRWLQ